jgi:hypothetical protein
MANRAPSRAEIDEATRRCQWLSEAIIATEPLAFHDDEAMLRLIANALDSTYELWETARRLQEIRTGSKHLTDSTLSTPEAQTTAALVFARGCRTHQLASFGRINGFGEGPFGEEPFGGGWHWQPLPTGSDYPRRRHWYAQLVENRLITPVLRVGERFLVNEVKALL